MTAIANKIPVPRYDMLALVRSFPSLKRDAIYWKKRVDTFEFDAVRLNKWARTDPAVTSGSLHAALFILQVWNPDTKWTAGRFNVARAFQVWDYHHHSAFMAWARDPWFP